MAAPKRYRFLVGALIVFTAFLFQLDKTTLDHLFSSSPEPTTITNSGSTYESTESSSTATTKTSSIPVPTLAPISVSVPPHTPVPVHATTTASPTTLPPYPRAANLTRTATVVVKLSGELANNLHHLAHGIGIQEWALREMGIETKLVIHRGPNAKWKVARKDIDKCFPTLAKWPWENPKNDKDFASAMELQTRWLGQSRHDYMTGLLNSGNPFDVQRGLEFLSNEILSDPERPLVDPGSRIQLPVLLSLTLDVFPMVDRYVDKLRQVFEFDQGCCARIPDLHETVFHFRNYMSELPFWQSMGFEELSPNKTVHELFQSKNFQRGKDHITVTTRIPNKYARAYVDAMEEKLGVPAELISNHTGLQDFCFLKETKKELVGNARSTFVFWAAVLGNVRKARLYHVDHYGLRERHPQFWERFTYNFSNADLKDRINFELYRSEEVDRKEGQHDGRGPGG